MREKQGFKYSVGQRVRYYRGDIGKIVGICPANSMDDYTVRWESGPLTSDLYPRTATAAEENLTPIDAETTR